jgi:uncharacterized protein YjiK
MNACNHYISTLKSTVIRLCLLVSVCAIAACSATNSNEPFPTPQQYDLNHPYKLQLSAQLDEISGIAYYPKDTSLFAIVDEEGWLYKIYAKNQAPLQKWKFGKKGDYEDVILIDSLFYVLKSNGDITRIQFSIGDSVRTETYIFPETGNNEFESLYYDKNSGNIEMLCKDCFSDKKKTLSVWSFNIDNKSYSLSPHMIDVAPIAHTLGEDKIRFKPSATAINPLTKELYMVSAVNKVLVIADTSGKVTEVYPLNPSLFAQPEGIAFTPAGDLLISNEINMGAYANVLLFKNKQVRK